MGSWCSTRNGGHQPRGHVRGSWNVASVCLIVTVFPIRWEHVFKNWVIPQPSLYDIHHHLKLLVVEDKRKEVVQMVFSSPAGLLEDRRTHTAAKFLMAMLTEGTQDKEKAVITDQLDRCGAMLLGSMTKDRFTLGLKTMPKYFLELLPLFAEVLAKPSLTEEGLARQKKVTQQQLSIAKESPLYLANEKINTLLFGKDHPYSYTMEEEDISSLQASDLRALYEARAWYPGVVALSGKVDKAMIEAIQKSLVNLPSKAKPSFPSPTSQPSQEKRCFIDKEGPQSALFLETEIIELTHPDYFALYILNYLLGGPYLGSRLMGNIREEKGHTYGINSWTHPHSYATILGITAQVKKGFAEETYRAVCSEIKRLQEEPISTEELKTVKENLKSTLRTWCDNKEAIASMFMSYYFLGIDFKRLDQLYKKVEEVTPQELQRVAKEHLDSEKLYCVIVNK
ncbi:MAG: pitrilysin family protein [Bacteroidota bacterium]